MPLILIVDDDPDMAELLGHMLDILSLEHHYVSTGEEALEIDDISFDSDAFSTSWDDELADGIVELQPAGQ